MWHWSCWLMFWSIIGNRGRVVVCLPLIVDLRHKAAVVVRVVGHMLCPPVWQCHCVGAFDSAYKKKLKTIVEADY